MNACNHANSALRLSQSIRRHGRATPGVKAAAAELVAARNSGDATRISRAIAAHAAALVGGGFRKRGGSI